MHWGLSGGLAEVGDGTLDSATFLAANGFVAGSSQWRALLVSGA